MRRLYCIARRFCRAINLEWRQRNLACAGKRVMDLAIRQLHPLFVAEVSGADLSRDVDLATRNAVAHAMALRVARSTSRLRSAPLTSATKSGCNCLIARSMTRFPAQAKFRCHHSKLMARQNRRAIQ